VPCPVGPDSHGSDPLSGSGNSRCCYCTIVVAAGTSVATGIAVDVAAAPGCYMSPVCSKIDPAGGLSIGLLEIGSRILVSESGSVLVSAPDPVRSPARVSSVVGSRPLSSSGSSLDEPTC
jgi:hypothetical protein